MAEVIYAGDAGAFKTCSKCGETKSLQRFYVSGGKLAGRRADCDECSKARRRLFHKKYPEVSREYSKKFHAENPNYAAEYAVKNAPRIREWNSKYFLENKDAYRERTYKWRDENRARSREIDLKAYRKRQATPKGQLDHAMSAGVWASLKGTKAGRGTYEILGYTLNDLVSHLEKLFVDGMSWENYGEWHVDHVIPKSIFNYSSPDHVDFKRAWALSNLQPLWAVDNHTKHAKYSGNFQPSLALG